MRTRPRVRSLAVALLVTCGSTRSHASSDAPPASPLPPASATPEPDPETIVIYADPPPPEQPVEQPVYAPWQPPPLQPAPVMWSPPVEQVPPVERPRDPAVRHWRMRAQLGALFGSTSDELNFMLSGVGGRSRLDYSLDTLTAGLDVAYLGGGGGRWPWSIAASLVTNITDPFGTLLDRDWITSSGTTTEFSHTDSRLTARVWLLETSLRFGLAGWRRRPERIVLDAVIGYRHEALAFDGWGLSGWQLAYGMAYSVYRNPQTRVIHFETQRAMPHVGLAIHGHVSARMLLDADALVALAISVDDDDHVLRFKRSNATSTGAGFILRVAPRWIVYGAESGAATVSLGLDFGLRYLGASGTLHQRFYADDPATPRDERTIPIVDSAFAVTSLVGWAHGTIDVAF